MVQSSGAYMRHQARVEITPQTHGLRQKSWNCEILTGKTTNHRCQRNVKINTVFRVFNHVPSKEWDKLIYLFPNVSIVRENIPQKGVKYDIDTGT